MNKYLDLINYYLDNNLPVDENLENYIKDNEVYIESFYHDIIKSYFSEDINRDVVLISIKKNILIFHKLITYTIPLLIKQKEATPAILIHIIKYFLTFNIKYNKIGDFLEEFNQLNIINEKNQNEITELFSRMDRFVLDYDLSLEENFYYYILYISQYFKQTTKKL